MSRSVKLRKNRMDIWHLEIVPLTNSEPQSCNEQQQ